MSDTERDSGVDDEFTVAQDGDYEPDDGPVDDDERFIEDDEEEGFPDDERPVVLDEPDEE